MLYVAEFVSGYSFVDLFYDVMKYVIKNYRIIEHESLI